MSIFKVKEIDTKKKAKEVAQKIRSELDAGRGKNQPQNGTGRRGRKWGK
jgi:hypothetical protein